MDKIFSIYAVVAICIEMGTSLGGTENIMPSRDRFDFFDAELIHIFNQEYEGNFLISPISVKILLGMLEEGSSGETAEEIRATLRLPNEREESRREFDRRMSNLQAKSPNSLKVASQIFLSDRYVINSDYGKILKKHYEAGVTKLSLENASESSRVINHWIRNQTSNLITGIVEESQLKTDVGMIATSALYFRGIWSSPFPSERTAARCFYGTDNKCKDSVMMTQTGYFNYGYISRLDAQAIQLPYEGETFSMLFLLPRKGNRIKHLSRDLIHVNLKSIQSEMSQQEVLLQIPRFEIAHNTDLVDKLKKLDISRIFDRHAKISNILLSHSEPVAVSRILHSTKITVDEEGSEAAAATGALFVPLMGGTTTTFIANRPFLFFVLNSETNSIIFSGKVSSPESPANREKAKTDKIELFASDERFETTTAKKTLDQRTLSPGSSFRAIKAAFPQDIKSRPFSSYRKNPSLRPGNRLPIYHQYFPIPSSDKVKRGKVEAEVVETENVRQEIAVDDWRHHVLFFS